MTIMTTAIIIIVIVILIIITTVMLLLNPILMLKNLLVMNFLVKPDMVNTSGCKNGFYNSRSLSGTMLVTLNVLLLKLDWSYITVKVWNLFQVLRISLLITMVENQELLFQPVQYLLMKLKVVMISNFEIFIKIKKNFIRKKKNYKRKRLKKKTKWFLLRQNLREV